METESVYTYQTKECFAVDKFAKKIRSNLCTTVTLGKWQGDHYIQGHHYYTGQYCRKFREVVR